MSSLSFCRIYDMNLIPRSLFQQLKKGDFEGYSDKDLDRLYLYGQLVGQDRLTQIYAMVDEEKKIRGVLWLSIDPITLVLYVTLCVIDPGFQNYKKNITEVVNFCRKIRQQLGLKKVRAFTKNPNVYTKLFGAKKSKLTCVEVD